MRGLPRLLKHAVHLVGTHPLWVVLAASLLSVFGGFQARTLTVDTDLANLLPERFPSVVAINRLREAVGAESTVDVAIASPSFEANRRFAEALLPAAMALRAGEDGEPYFTRVDYTRDLRFLKENALYFATPDELDALGAYLDAQGRRIRRIAEGDDIEATDESPGVEGLFEALGLSEYPISEDSTVLALRFYPAGSQTNVGYIDALYRDLDSLIARLGPQRYHPAMEVTSAGRLLRQSVEVHAITDDVLSSFGAGVGTVLLLVVLYFLYKSLRARRGRGHVLKRALADVLRMPAMAAVLGVPLLMSLTWTGGVAAVAFGSLNLMTSTLGLVLFGLGIDYGIHFYARYTEERGAGRDVEAAIEATLTSTGPAIVVSALTTAASLFVLTLADFRGFSEFGWIGGIGILFAMVTMLLVLPALLNLAERWKALDFGSAALPSEPAPTSSGRVERGGLVVTGVSVVLCIASLVLLPQIWFEYDFGELDPTYPEYEARAAEVRPVYDTEGRLRNPAYLLLENPSDVRPVLSALRQAERRDSLILTVLSLQERFPTDSVAVRRKLDRLAALREKLDDPFLQLDTTGAVAALREALSITEPIPLDSVPDFLTRPFTTKEGEVGNFVLVYPSASLSDGRLSMRFADLVGQVEGAEGEIHYAASTSIVAADMLRLMLNEAPRMVGVTTILIVAFLLLSFRSVRWTVLALLPLGVGLMWMLLAMEVANVPFTFYNLVVLPAILGIGNDAGVHLVHRYRHEGVGSMPAVLRSTGEHLGMGALTTLVGFAGLLLSFHPGLRSIGVLAVLGITATMLASLVFLPALIRVLERLGLLHTEAGEAAP